MTVPDLPTWRFVCLRHDQVHRLALPEGHPYRWDPATLQGHYEEAPRPMEAREALGEYPLGPSYVYVLDPRQVNPDGTLTPFSTLVDRGDA